MQNYRTDCKFFNGYKPCAPGKVCPGCEDFQKTGACILIINLDAQGTVLRTTALLPAIERKYPDAFIVQLTDKKAASLLAGNPYLDRVYEYGIESLSVLMCEEYDVLFSVDKSRRACAAAALVKARDKRGYTLNKFGAIVPFKDKASLHYALGLDDDKKFFQNERPEQDLLAEMFGLPYERDEYVLNLSNEEQRFCGEYRAKLGIKPDEVVIGFNVGSSELFPFKKIDPGVQIEVIKMLNKRAAGVKILLLGGREDTAIIERMKKSLGRSVIATPTTEGLRRGICYTTPCDIVVTADSLGMHMAIGLKKRVAAWFGPTCENEIELYDRGIKIVSDAKCRPCWKLKCDKAPKCNETVDIDRLTEAVMTLYDEASAEKGA